MDNVKYCPFRRRTKEIQDGGMVEDFKDCLQERCMAYQLTTNSCGFLHKKTNCYIGFSPNPLIDQTTGKPYPASCGSSC